MTAGLDLGLSLVGILRDVQYAEWVQLLAEYSPEPPYNSGTPERASGEIKTMTDSMFADFLKHAETVGRAAFGKANQL